MNSISFSHLGKYGRLGNQMFQVACVLSLCKDKGFTPRFPLNADINKVFKLNYSHLEDLKKPVARWREKHFAYDSSINNINTDTDIIGYLQSEKYFINNKDYIINQFTFSEKTIKKSLELLPTGEVVSIHVRRGDYLKYPKVHPICTMKYYINSMNFLKSLNKDIKFVIFSDDIEWCRINFNDCIFIHETEEIDLCAMSMCNHNIIANSSFSWWAGYLNRNVNKIVIAPNVWFGPNGPKDTQDLIPDNFKILEC